MITFIFCGIFLQFCKSLNFNTLSFGKFKCQLLFARCGPLFHWELRHRSSKSIFARCVLLFHWEFKGIGQVSQFLQSCRCIIHNTSLTTNFNLKGKPQEIVDRHFLGGGWVKHHSSSTTKIPYLLNNQSYLTGLQLEIVDHYFLCDQVVL